MSEYVKKIAAEEFAAQIAKSFSSSDSPYGHVDAEQVCSPLHFLLSLRKAHTRLPLAQESEISIEPTVEAPSPSPMRRVTPCRCRS